MKKDKKYWKRQAKSWREIAEMETESANEFAGEVLLLKDELEELQFEYDQIKSELISLRQYNIGRPHSNERKPRFEEPKIETYSAWNKNIPANPFKKCKCQKCTCKKS